MEYTAIAQWLNTTFAGYDSAILSFMNTMAGKAGGVLTPLMKVITFLGEKGIIFFLLALGFMCFSRTRKMGVCMFGAVCCGALITNIILKDMVARPRPFEYMAVYKSYWDYLGSPAESGFSFPSGHVTAVAAGMGSLCFTKGKKMIVPSVLVVVLMAVSRNYLMAHFPSDVLFAAVIGALSAVIAYLITRAIFIYLEDNDDFPFCATLLYFDLPVRLPDKDAVAGFVNRAGKTTGKSTRRATAERGAARRGDGEGTHSAKPTRTRETDGATEGAFSGALRFAMNAGSELLGKNAAKRTADTDEDETEPKREPPKRESVRREPPKRKSASTSPSDWSSRWDSYRSAKDGAKRSDAPAGEFTARFAADQYAHEDAVITEKKPTVQLDDEDADMKIVPERGKKKAGFNWGEVEDVSVPKKKATAPVREPEVDDSDLDLKLDDIMLGDDGIDWASLGLSELAADDYGLDLASDEDEPVIRRRDRGL